MPLRFIDCAKTQRLASPHLLFGDCLFPRPFYIAVVRTIYFDYNATTPLDSRVREAMLPYLGEVYGNPSSVHHVGRRARSLLDDARDRVAKVWRCKPSEVVFTSGGTESNNLAIFGTARRLRDKGRHIVTTSVEHDAVLQCCEYLVNKEGFEVTYLPVDGEGRVDAGAVQSVIRNDTILVSVMAANNEIGTIQPEASFSIPMPCKYLERKGLQIFISSGLI